MDKHLATFDERALREAEEGSIQEVEPLARANAFLRFQYSCTQITAAGSSARVKSRNVRLEDGKLTDESFECEMDRSAYEHSVARAHQFFLGQAESLMKSFATMLSFWQPKR